MAKRTERRQRRGFGMLIGVGIGALLVIIAAVTPSPYVVERPGPVLDTLGEVPVAAGDGDAADARAGETEPLLTIDGARTYPTTGELSLTTVTVVGSPEHPLHWLSLAWPALDPDQRVADREEFFPSGVSEKQRNEANDAMMTSSQSQAAVAAARGLGMEVPATLTVAQVLEDGPAVGALQAGDELVAIDGEALESVSQLRGLVADAGTDGPVTLDIVRDGDARAVDVTPTRPEGAEQALLGVTVGTAYDMPFDVHMSVEDIGGPSAGMIFALAITDMLTDEDLAAGAHIAGTGTIDDTGAVGAIGGLPQKLAGAADAGAELFLMPLGNCGDLPAKLPDGMRVAPVADLDEATHVLEAAAQGEDFAGPERCDTNS